MHSAGPKSLKSLKSNGYKGFFNACMALIMERFNEPLRSRYLGSALGLGHVGHGLSTALAQN